MNTIEQAREFSKALRIRSAYGSEARQAVDTIDTLLASLQERDETIKDLQALCRTQTHFLQEAHDELNEVTK